MISLSKRVNFVERIFGSFTHDRAFLNLSIACPWCLDKDPGYNKKKLVIRTDCWIYHCWRCGKHDKTIVSLLKKIGANEYLSEYYEKFAKSTETIESSDEDKILSLPSDFLLLAEVVDSNDYHVNRALSYLYSRGVDYRGLWYFKFGISFNEKFINRIILPSFDSEGRLNYYSARRINDISWMKYINCAMRRTQIIFNEINIDWANELCIVEGPFDLVKCPDNSVPLLGCELTQKALLFQKIVEHNTPIVIMLDADAMHRTNRLAKRLLSYGITIRIADIGDADDPAVMTKAAVTAAIKNASLWSSDYALRSSIAAI